MKKTLLTLAIGAIAATSALAQGTIAVYTVNASFAMYTNGATYSSALNGVYNTTGGKTVSTANSYYYALLFQPYNPLLTAINPLDVNYSLGMMATNLSTGGIRGSGASTGAPVTGWGAPGNTYDTAERNNFLLVGWSANLGQTWAQVATQLETGNWIAPGFFGISSLGNSYAGGGPLSLGAVNIFGVSAGAPGGLTGGLTLYATPVPEPSSIALAGLGALSLLAFRRRK